MAMAGIIGASTNNSSGIVGIAPNVSILPISVNFNIVNRIYLGMAVMYAANVGADVISNSWSGDQVHATRDEAFEYALDKGCILVQSMGNYSSTVPRYPYKLYPQVITVGNINSDGIRENSSNYGEHLDIVAPGTSIRTLNSTSGYQYSTGTSPACPHVAATAALMLSINPDLTRQDVTDIIERTARKLPAYTFSTTSQRLNGTWNNEVGYGLINSLDAITMAHHYKDDSYLDLIEFDYTGNQVEMALKANEDIAIIWDWDTKDITFIHTDSALDTTLTHTYNSSGSRHIKISELIAPGEAPDTTSTALIEFDLKTGNLASNIDIKSINSSLEYLRIIGGANFSGSTIRITDLPSLRELYLTQLRYSNIYISYCPSLKYFGTSRHMWYHGNTVAPVHTPYDIITPNVVGGGTVIIPGQWPAIPESNMSPAFLKITECGNILALSLENVGFTSFSFSGLNNLSYVYLSSQDSKIVGAGSSTTSIITKGYHLSSAVSSLPSISSTIFPGKIVIRAVNSTNTGFTPVKISSQYKNTIQNYCADNGWNLVWDSGIE